jgi:outer membrane protein OmpA-like peptidoglycan-associated protein
MKKEAMGMSNTVRESVSLVIWRILLFCVISVLFLYFMMARSCGTEQVSPKVDSAYKTVSEVAGSLGSFFTFKLPNGTELSIPEFGVEKKFIAFIQDANQPVDKTTWFTFDRLEFETGSAILKSSSHEQLQNVAQILKAFPQVNIKIGGYTDNTGNPDANLKLSENRAINTHNALVAMGIDAKRMEAEGYGQEHPVADNATAEGRQKNRRIDFRVAAK